MAKKLKVAVIGLGQIGSVVAANLVKANRPVILADRSVEKAKALAGKLGSLAEAAEIPSAITKADIIVFSIWFDAIKELLKTYGAELQGKIVVDPSNPIALDENGGFKKTIGQKESAGKILSALLPKGSKLAKVLGTLGVDSLQQAAFRNPEKAVLFYATDDTSIHDALEELIRDSGFEAVHVGNLSQSIRLEVFGDLHEFGALGKTVSLSEANSKL